jgi:hypothetical protein
MTFTYLNKPVAMPNKIGITVGIGKVLPVGVVLVIRPKVGEGVQPDDMMADY